MASQTIKDSAPFFDFSTRSRPCFSNLQLGEMSTSEAIITLGPHDYTIGAIADPEQASQWFIRFLNKLLGFAGMLS